MPKTLRDLTEQAVRSEALERESTVRQARGEKASSSQGGGRVGPVSGRQLAIDLVEAQRDRVAAGVAMGPSQEPMYWVQRFSQDTNERVGLFDGRDPVSRGHLTPVTVPPPMAERIRSPVPPPPSSRPDTLRVPTSLPGSPPLPRFALGPRMDGLFGPDRPPGSSKPSSLAPVTSHEQASGRFHTNPWVAGAIGAGITVAAGVVLLWVPSRISSLAVEVMGPSREPPRFAVSPVPVPTSSSLPARPGFREEEARELAMLAGQDAAACGLGAGEVEVVLTFWPDGAVSHAVVDSFWMDGAARRCLDRAFFGLRALAFEGEPRTLALALPDPSVESLR